MMSTTSTDSPKITVQTDGVWFVYRPVPSVKQIVIVEFRPNQPPRLAAWSERDNQLIPWFLTFDEIQGFMSEAKKRFVS